jgi:subtilase family serine protease
MSKSRAILCLLSSLVVCASLSFAATADRISGGITGGPAVTLRGNIHHLALPQFDQGSVDPAMQLGTITLVTVPTPAQQQALKQLLAQQQNRKSPLYHKWLTPEQYADRFGLSKNDIQQLAAWLQGQGFTMVHTARGRNWVSFTGTAAQIENALGTEIHHYNVKGQMHYANATAPKIPQALAGIVAGFRGLNDFRPRPMNQKRTRPYWYSSTQGDFIAPGDFATIYDINALYTGGIDGTGQKIAVMGQTDIYLADLNDFRAGFGLSSLTCTTNATTGVITACSDPHFEYVLDGSDPGLSTNGDILESDLDLEWSGAVASGAQIIFVNSTDTFTSFYYAIDNDLAPVISLSYGACEFDDNFILSATGSGEPLSNEAELQKANAEGITFVNSSGDSGAAECDSASTVTNTNLATNGLAVSYPASSPEVTGVGGTGVTLAAWDSSTYWGTTNGTSGGSALSYMPEQVWNDALEISQYCASNSTNLFCTQGGSTKVTGWVPITSEATAQTDIGLSAGGGGSSDCSAQNASFSACVSGFPQPSWQTVTISGQTTRMSPDISFLASPNFPGYVICTPQSELSSSSTSTQSSCVSGISTAVDTYLSIIGGTSASAPVFAGIVALMNQYTSSAGQGNINPTLYQLAATAPNAFHDITSGDNNAYCEAGTPTGQLSSLLCPTSGVIGYSASTGFDMASGLGSVDVDNFAVALASPPDFTASTPTTTLSVFDGQSGSATITVVPINNFTGSVSFSCSGVSGVTCSFSPSSVAPPGTTQTTATISAASGAGSGTLVITATTGVLSQVSHQAASIATTTSTPFTLAPTATSFQVAQGSNVNATVTLTLNSGFSGMVAFTCSDPASASICTAPPNTNVSGNVTFQITTTAPTSKLQRPMDRGTRIFYAALLPGLMGIVFAGSRKRSLRGMRLLAMLMLLGVSTLWMASCGGSNSGNTTTNPGTPTGTYTINVTGASGGATATSSFQLVVQ